MADSLDDIAVARRAGKLAMGVNVQDSLPIGRELDRVETFRRLGVWHMLLAYQTRSLAADGCAEPDDAGLSLFGRALVQRMNAEGVVVDCAHTGLPLEPGGDGADHPSPPSSPTAGVFEIQVSTSATSSATI